MEKSHHVLAEQENYLVSPAKEEWMGNGLIKHNLVRPQGLIKCDTVLDIGSGIRPMQWYTPKHHICCEPYITYAERLAAAGYTVLFCNAIDALFIDNDAQTYIQKVTDRFQTEPEAIYLLDVIEHMEKEEGEEVIELAKKIATKQIVIYTPHGFLQQEGDAWGLGGDYWQKHRSGWLPGEFPDWHTYRLNQGFFAIWTTPTHK